MPLSDLVRVEVSLGTAAFAAPSWTDISGDVFQVALRTGRTGGAGGRTDPGRVTVDVYNDSRAASGAGAWDRNNPASPYGTDIARNRRIRVTCSDDNFTSSRVLFVGFLDNVVPSSTAHFSTAKITATDATRFLAEYDIADLERNQEFTGERVEAIVDTAGIPASLKGTFDHGVVMVDAETLSTTALKACQELQRSEYGLFYVDNTGTINFRDRYAPLAVTGWSTSQVTWTTSTSVTDSVIVYQPVTTDQGGFHDVTRVTASGVTGTTFEFDTTGANEPATTRHVVNTDALFDADSLIAAEAWQKGWEFSSQRPRDVTLYVLPGSAALTAMADGTIDLFNRVTLNYQPVGWASAYTYDARIEALEHTIKGAEGSVGWECRVGLSPHQTTWQTDSANWYQLGTVSTATSVPAL